LCSVFTFAEPYWYIADCIALLYYCYSVTFLILNKLWHFTFHVVDSKFRGLIGLEKGGRNMNNSRIYDAAFDTPLKRAAAVD